MTSAELDPASSDVAGRVTVVVPAYNESASLPETLPGLLDYAGARAWPVVVVDDGSDDATSDVLATFAGQSGLTVVRHKVRRGYGGAIKSGIDRAETPFVVTIDADGQHRLEDIEALLQVCDERDADMVVGDRGARSSSVFREIGKRLIRMVTRLLVPLPIRDLNSGMKLYRTDLAKRYLVVCPDSMAYSDVITLAFVHGRCLVVEHPITTVPRVGGASTISTATAFDTVLEILNIITLFNPMRIFLPLSLVGIAAGVLWGMNRFFIVGDGLSVGALLAILTGVILFLLGLIAEQLSVLRRLGRD